MASAALTSAKATPSVQPDSDTLYEVVNGERREIPHMGAWSGTVASMLAFYLNAFALPRKLGLAVTEVLFRPSEKSSSRRPDVAFVASDRWQVKAVLTDDPPEWTVAPNLAVEVISPTNTADEVLEKVREYFEVGVQLVWVVYPRQRMIYVYESFPQPRVLKEGDELDGGQVLPEFRLSLAALFSAAVMP
jgi:Uma2 family endonuclease